MEFEKKSDLPKRYHEQVDQIGLEGIQHRLGRTASVAEVAAVEKTLEDLEDILVRTVYYKDEWGERKRISTLNTQNLRLDLKWGHMPYDLTSKIDRHDRQLGNLAEKVASTNSKANIAIALWLVAVVVTIASIIFL
jgi:hypothetical protein